MSAEKAVSKFYNVEDETEKVTLENKTIYNIIVKSIIVLDSVCYVVIKNE